MPNYKVKGQLHIDYEIIAETDIELTVEYEIEADSKQAALKKAKEQAEQKCIDDNDADRDTVYSNWTHPPEVDEIITDPEIAEQQASAHNHKTMISAKMPTLF